MRTWKEDISGYFVSKSKLNFMGQPHLWLSTISILLGQFSEII